jgi:hypothetical protein
LWEEKTISSGKVENKMHNYHVQFIFCNIL